MTPGPDVDISPAYALHRCPLKPKAVRYPVQWCNLPHIKVTTEHQNDQVLLKRGGEDPPSNPKLRYSRPPKSKWYHFNNFLGEFRLEGRRGVPP